MLSWTIRCMAIMAGLAAAIAYGSGADLQQLIARWRPGMQTGPAAAAQPAASVVALHASELRIRVHRDGHYYLDAMVNGTPVRFLVDTGASMVALNASDAARIGLRPMRADYRYRVQTANGTALMAGATLRNVTVGGFTAREVPGMVAATLAGESLLGMSFLSQLQSFGIENGTLILRW